jgi:Uncharacterized conserved protein
MVMNIRIVKIKKDDENVIIGQSHFIKTVEDFYEALATASPGIKFGLAFCEASGKRLVRHDGNDAELEKRAVENAMNVGAGHSFIIHIKNAYPINVLPHLRSKEELVNIFAATANDLSVVVIDEGDQSGIIGVLDGYKPLGIEGNNDIEDRKKFLRDIGYKR